MPARMDVVICEPLRTPVGRIGGALAALSAAELADDRARASSSRRTGLGEGDVDDVVLGNGYPNGEAPAIGRVAALDAGSARACRACRSTAAAARACRPCSTPPCRSRRARRDLVVAGGAESMSQRRALRHSACAGASRQGGVELHGPPRPRPARPPAASTTRCPAA